MKAEKFQDPESASWRSRGVVWLQSKSESEIDRQRKHKFCLSPHFVSICLQGIGWNPPTMERTIWFTQYTDSSVNLIRKHPDRHIGSFLTKYLGTLGPTSLTHKRESHRNMTWSQLCYLLSPETGCQQGWSNLPRGWNLSIISTIIFKSLNTLQQQFHQIVVVGLVSLPLIWSSFYNAIIGRPLSPPAIASAPHSCSVCLFLCPPLPILHQILPALHGQFIFPSAHEACTRHWSSL